MDAPPIQYATTDDGVSIAFATRGEGRNFVLAPLPHQHVQLIWQQPGDNHQFLTGLAGRYRLVSYDARGQGLSSRDIVQDTTPESFVRDLEAVVDHLGLQSFVLYGWGNVLGHVAVHYASKHPERVEALILQCSAVHPLAWPASLFVDLPTNNWEVYLNQVARARAQGALRPGTSGPAAMDAAAFLDHLHRSVKQEDWLVSLKAFMEADEEPLLRRLKVPTLILHPRDFTPLSVEAAVKLAALIPGARLTLLDGSNLLGDPAQLLQAIEHFLESVPPSTETRWDSQRDDRPGVLSAREVEVLRLLAAGKSNAQIAEELVISQNTVIRHVSNIFAKIGAANRAEAASYATRNGIA
jgi:pimeloyl-ACP methyl ester carboxylesterase/DNA-binding CsgD family transcriptional regulator